MSTRFLLSNGIKVLLLLAFVVSASDTIKALCVVGLAASLAVDFALYRRDRKALGEDEDTDQVSHVPMPPTRPRRDER